jgi:hypothetical protein
MFKNMQKCLCIFAELKEKWCVHAKKILEGEKSDENENEDGNAGACLSIHHLHCDICSSKGILWGDARLLEKPPGTLD